MNVTTQELDLFTDVCARKHGGNAASVAAYERGRRSFQSTRLEILRRIQAAGAEGMTLKELCAAMGKTPNQISGRLTTLKGNMDIVVGGWRGLHSVYFPSQNTRKDGRNESF